MDQAVAGTTQEVTVDEVMTRRFDLVEQIAIIGGKHKAELEPFAEELNLCEKFIQNYMNEQNLENVKTTAGQAFFKTADGTGIEDWDTALAFIQANGLWHFLKKDVNKTAVKEFIEANQTPPPGVKYTTFRSLNWRRGKGT